MALLCLLVLYALLCVGFVACLSVATIVLFIDGIDICLFSMFELNIRTSC